MVNSASKDLARKILKKREGEVVLGLFKVGRPGERLTFPQLTEEFCRSHTSTLSPKSQRNHELFSKKLVAFLGQRRLAEISQKIVEDYRDYPTTAAIEVEPATDCEGSYGESRT